MPPPTERAIADSNLLIRLDERQIAIIDKLEEILIEAKKTNGRINELEKWKNQMHGGWRATAFIASGLGVIVGVLISYALK